MVEPDERIESNLMAHDREIPDQQTVRDRQQRIDRIPRRTPVPRLEIERRPRRLVLDLDHSGEVLEIGARRRALDAEQHIDFRRGDGQLHETLQLFDRPHGRLDVIPLQQGPPGLAVRPPRNPSDRSETGSFRPIRAGYRRRTRRSQFRRHAD